MFETTFLGPIFQHKSIVSDSQSIATDPFSWPLMYDHICVICTDLI